MRIWIEGVGYYGGECRIRKLYRERRSKGVRGREGGSGGRKREREEERGRETE